ncbi:MAG: glycosyltransferase [Actinobacteria bacterium]|nr:glycosyltransferase [Actinomycetota bacterium]
MSNPDRNGPRVSVIVPMRDSESLLPGLLASLDEQTLAPELFEVVLVDDGSRDGTRALAAAWAAADSARRRLVAGEGRGPAAARNLGVAAAHGRWIAFTDSDTRPDSRWLESALVALDSTGARALEGAIGPWPEGAVDGHRVLNPTGGRYMTANMVYERELLQRLGGFDEHFEAPFLEDSDLAFRALAAGFEIPFAPQVVVRHPVVEISPRDFLGSARKLRWLALLAAKHPDRYRNEIRPLIRPVSSIDIDVALAGLAALGLPRASGLARLACLAVAANGTRRALVSGRVLDGAGGAPARAAVSLALPFVKTFWILEGSIRFRKLVW